MEIHTERKIFSYHLLRRFNDCIKELDKGQIKPKADWRAAASPKTERTNIFLLLLYSPWQKNKQIRLFVFWENLRPQICLWFYLTFSFLDGLPSKNLKDLTFLLRNNQALPLGRPEGHQQRLLSQQTRLGTTLQR